MSPLQIKAQNTIHVRKWGKKAGGGKKWISDIMDWTHVAFWVEKGGTLKSQEVLMANLVYHFRVIRIFSITAVNKESFPWEGAIYLHITHWFVMYSKRKACPGMLWTGGTWRSEWLRLCASDAGGARWLPVSGNRDPHVLKHRQTKQTKNHLGEEGRAVFWTNGQTLY